MKFLKAWLGNGRVRDAKKRLAADPSARHYALLANEHALTREFDEALKVVREGLRAYPGDPELKRLSGHFRQLMLEDRTRGLARELETSARPALWREMCEVLLEAGRFVRAEESAAEWYRNTQSGEAQLFRARARAERFFSDRRRDDGRIAFELADAAEAMMPGDPRPLDLRAEISARAGVWGEARKDLARLLEMMPGDPGLEGRYRTAMAMFEGPKTIDQALREVEKSGRLADERRERPVSPDPKQPQQVDEFPEEPVASPVATARVRPLLQSISRAPGVQAAFYLRGSTALVQGPKGPTAERTARAVREILQASRGAGRKLGLGQVSEVRLEGDFGTLLLTPGDLGAGALWVAGAVTRRHEEGLRDISAAATSVEGAP